MANLKMRHFYLDLFSGAGGTSLGLEKAGFHSVGAVEKDQRASETYHLNFGPPLLPCLNRAGIDIKRLDPKVLKRELSSVGIPRLDLLVATPPCQGFSSIGRGKLKSLRKGKCYSGDARNSLYNYFLNFVDVLKPNAILFENVPGMLNMKGINVVEVICEELQELGYTVRATLLNSSWYGVPQSRERVFIIGYRNDLSIEPKFPAIKYDTKSIGGHWGQGKHFGCEWKSPEIFIREDKLPKSNLC